jgi:hypothetical protein
LITPFPVVPVLGMSGVIPPVFIRVYKMQRDGFIFTENLQIVKNN